MTKPDVSIIVAVYNAEDYIGRCLESLTAQTYKNIEIICVNDASTDHSQQIIDSYMQKDERILSVVHQQNMNAGGAMNDGIKTAKGEYVCIVDNDDWIEYNAIEELLNESEGFKYDIVTCDWYALNDEKNKKWHKNLTDSPNKVTIIQEALINGYRLLGSLIRRSIFVDNTLFFPEKVFYEDNAIGLCILFYAKTIKPVHKPLYFYYLSENSVTRSVSMKKVVDRIYTTDMFLTNLTQRGFVNEHNIKLINYTYLCFTHHTILMLANIGTDEARMQIGRIETCTREMMPNDYITKYKPNFVYVLNHPYRAYLLYKVLYIIKRMIPQYIITKIKTYGR